MGEHPARSVTAELARLREDYVRRLPARLTQLCEQADAALESLEREAIEAVREIAHRLKGSSGSHRLADISREMSVAEAACERLLRQPADPGVWRELSDALTRAQALACDR